jgi:hypothetical protein
MGDRSFIGEMSSPEGYLLDWCFGAPNPLASGVAPISKL